MTQEWSIIDSHTHLTWADLMDDRALVLARARAAAVHRMVTIGVDAESSVQAVALAQAHDGWISASVGVHPNEADRWHEHWPRISALAAESGVVAIGETGLDYYRQRALPAAQLEALAAHVDLAEVHQLPLIIHLRDAAQDFTPLLRSITARVQVIMHCFSGDADLATECISLGCMLSFAGNITYPKNRALLAVAVGIPLDHLLVETDAPFLAPQPWRGRRNEPAYVRATAECLAEARGMPIATLATHICANAARVFGWSPSL